VHSFSIKMCQKSFGDRADPLVVFSAPQIL